MSTLNAYPEPGEDIARYLVPDLLKPGEFLELEECFPLWWNSLKPNIPQSIRSWRFEKAVDSFRSAHKAVEEGKDDWRKCQLRDALAVIMWKDLSSFTSNREPERTRITFSWLFDLLLTWSDDMDEMDKVNEFFVKFILDLSSMRTTTEISLMTRERCTQSYIDALAAFKPKRPAMITLLRLLRIEAYASLIQIASERAIQCWNLKQYKYARQALLVHESALSYAADLEREYEEAITERRDRRASKWMDGLNKLVHAADKENGYEYVCGRIAEAASDCQAYIKRCEARSEIDLGNKMFSEALLDDPAKIIEGVEDAQQHFRWADESANAAITAADCDWVLEGEALVRIGSTLERVFRRAGSAKLLYQRAIQLVDVHDGKDIAPWYEEAYRCLRGEAQVEAEQNEARWASIRAAVEGKLAEHLKPIEDYEGDLKSFIEWVWNKYPPLSTGGNTLPEGLFPPTEVSSPPRKKARGTAAPKPPIAKVSNSAFKKIVLRYHPDKGQERFGEVWKQTAETIIKQLNARRDQHHEARGMA